MTEARFVVSFRPAPKVFSLRGIIPNCHGVYKQYGHVVSDLNEIYATMETRMQHKRINNYSQRKTRFTISQYTIFVK